MLLFALLLDDVSALGLLMILIVVVILTTKSFCAAINATIFGIDVEITTLILIMMIDFIFVAKILNNNIILG